MYKIIGSLRSPFVRACRMLMIQNKIDFEFVMLNFVDDKEHAKELSKYSPINKVPILIDGDKKIFDSRVIVSYLSEKHDLPKFSIDEENILTSIYSCLDAGVILFLLKHDGIDINGPGFFFERQRARIPDNLNYLLPWVKTLDPANPRDWNYLSMSLYSFLYWGERRTGLFKVESYPEFAEFMKKFENAPGVADTGF